MIETKEQYEEFVSAAQKFPSLRFHQGDLNALIETIEALRDVARAAKPAVMRLQLIQAAGPIGASPKWTQDLADAVDALPDWLTDG